jgi:hypothetical protein
VDVFTTRKSRQGEEVDFETLVQSRRSVRGFKQQPVPRTVIEAIIDVAKRAPSSMNTQPWHVHVLTGEPLEEVRRRNMEEMIAGARRTMRGSTDSPIDAVELRAWSSRSRKSHSGIAGMTDCRALHSSCAGGNNRTLGSLLLARGRGMRRLADLVRRFFGPRLRRPVDDDPSLPFTSEEFARLIRSGKRADMKRLASGLACRTIPGRSAHRAAH